MRSAFAEASARRFARTRKSEPTGSGTFLSLDAFLWPKREISEARFSWVEPLKPTIWNLFDIRPKCRAKTGRFEQQSRVTDPRLIPFWQLVGHVGKTDNFHLTKKQLTRFIESPSRSISQLSVRAKKGALRVNSVNAVPDNGLAALRELPLS